MSQDDLGTRRKPGVRVVIPFIARLSSAHGRWVVDTCGQGFSKHVIAFSCLKSVTFSRDCKGNKLEPPVQQLTACFDLGSLHDVPSGRPGWLRGKTTEMARGQLHWPTQEIPRPLGESGGGASRCDHRHRPNLWHKFILRGGVWGLRSSKRPTRKSGLGQATEKD